MTLLDSWLTFALAALATWRVTHLLAEEDGPGAACLLERIGAGRPPWPGDPLNFPENNHELLRTRTDGPEG